MTSKRNNNILIRLKIICVIKKWALIFWYYKTTILKKKKKVSQKFLSRQKPISVGSKMISRNSDKFLETPFGRFSKFIGVSRNHFGPTEIGILPLQKFFRHFGEIILVLYVRLYIYSNFKLKFLHDVMLKLLWKKFF